MRAWSFILHFFFFFFCVPQLYLWGSPFWVRCLHMWPYFIQPLRSHSVFMDGACWVYFLLPTFTRLGHECQDLLSLCNGMHRLDLGLYSHPKEFGGNGVRTHVNSKGKIPSTRKKSPQRRIEPTTLHPTRQWAQHIANELFQPLVILHNS